MHTSLCLRLQPRPCKALFSVVQEQLSFGNTSSSCLWSLSHGPDDSQSTCGNGGSERVSDLPEPSQLVVPGGGI